MNASGMINISTASDLDHNGSKEPTVSFNAGGKTTGFDLEIESNDISANVHSAPLQPDPSLLTPNNPKRPNRFQFFNNPLSPIASSPENSPPSSPLASGGSSRPKHLQVSYTLKVAYSQNCFHLKGQLISKRLFAILQFF